MYHLRKLKSLLLLLLVAVTAKAQISDGKVYNFVNVDKYTQSLAISGVKGVSITGTDTQDYTQLWYVEGNSAGGYTLRNLGSGHYLRSSNAASEKWTMVKELDDNCKFNCTAAGSGYSLRATNTNNGGHYMHYGANEGAIVGWSTDAAATQWTINEVTSITSAALQTNWDELASIDPSAETTATYQKHLDNLFSDKACTTLKKSFANENAVKNDADYKALPATLQEMVLKVYNDSWAEDNYDANKSDWDSDYAKRYRVQWYEPYNEPEAAASALGINAHTNLNNPTGIFADNREALYVMVEGEIETGASLYITSYTGNGNLGSYDNGVELKQGLNIVPSFGDGNNYCINYVVHTFDTSKGKGNKAKAYRLSAFDDLKIHIEGGYINGYYNKMGDDLYTPDQGDDWDYLEARATQTTVTILGKYITLQFPLNDAIDNDGNTNKGMSYYLDQSNVEGIIDEWDNVMLWERLVLGLLDENTIKAEAKKSPYSDKERVFDYTGNDGEFAAGYGDYYNVHGLSLGVGYNYMYGGWDHCGYHYNTMESILTNLPHNAGSHWGPGHEIGHQHQSLLTVNGLTEVTNNLFANVVLWYYGETTSRVNGDQGSLSHVLAAFNTEGSDFFTNNIWALTHMYYKLFLYYHVLGHNPKFYPRLFEMLRQDPMKNGDQIDGATSLLRFYKKCCLASGDDLTEFFRAYGFFRVMTDRLVGDYSNGIYNMTQAQIDAAIAEVKALGYDENIAVLFINDATGETIKSHKGDNLDLYGETTICAEVGNYASFTANTTPDYTYSVSGTTVTMEGEGGTGFAIFNERGEIIAFSDKKTFEISSECVAAIASGKAEVKIVKADNTTVEATDVMDTDNTEAKYTLLGELLNAAKAVTDLPDETGKKVGYYRPASLAGLTAAYAEAKTVYDNQTSASYAAMYDVLFQAYTEVVNDDFARIGIIETNAYQLANKAYNGYSITDNGTSIYGTTASSDAQKWYFDSADSEGHYYIRNKSTGNYLTHAGWGSVVNVTQEIDNAQKYTLQDLGNGLWALTGGYSLHCSASQSYNVVGWGADAEASQWYITAVEVDQNAETLYELQTLITKTEALVDEMASVQYAGAVDMSTVTITSNATEEGHETKYLTDGNPNTFFHTVWSGSVVNDYHNIVIDLGEGHSLAEFALNYTTLPTSAHNVDAPESLTVQGSNDGSSYTDIASLSALHGLPITKGAEYTSSTLGTSSQAYRYIRLQVKTATGNKWGGYHYFGLAELALLRMTTLVDAIGDKYQKFITANELKVACDQVYAAQQTIASGSATSNDVAALQTQYDILLQAHQNANNVEFNAKREELLALINSTDRLIKTCGTITYTPATLDGELALQTNNLNGSWYVSSNADQNTGGGGNDGGGIAALVDNNYNTYFHTRWGGTTVSEPHHIQVDMGNGVAINDFVFSYKPRNGSPAPTSMIVYGSNDEKSFTEVLATIESGLPAHDSGKTYTSSTIVSDKAYRYLRFTVTGSQGPGNNKYNNQYFFGMLEFDLTAVGRPESYTAELGAQAGEATSDLLLATFHATNAAQEVYDEAITESQLQNAIIALQAEYDALHSAMYPDVEYTISSNAANGGVQYEGQNYTESLSAPTTLTVGKLTAIDLENEGYVAKSVTLNGRTITVTYNKVYNVQVVGVDAAGGVTLGETDYHVGDTINMLESEFDVKDFIAIPVTGYAAYKEFDNNATITVTYKKIYTVNVVGVAGQGGVVFESNNYTDAQELHALNLEIGNLTAIPLTGYVANVALEGTTITVTYMKKYTVCLYGEEGTGVIFYGDEQYQNGDVILVSGNIDENSISVQGSLYYDYDRVVVDHTLGTITINYTLIKSDMADYQATTTQLINDAAGVLDEAEIASFEARIDEIRTQCEDASLYNDYRTALDDWDAANNDFATAIETAKTAAVEAARNELRALIAKTTALIERCGTVEYTTTIDQVALQTGDRNADFWLSTNAQESSEGAIANLVGIVDEDGFFHSSWSAQVGAAHYLQVDMGAENSLKEFAFSYTTRDNGDGGPHPSIIVVSGSNSANGTFVELATINSGLPTTGNTAWNENNENVITASEAYRYLRFTVTASAGTNGCSHGNGEYYFAMARFSLFSISRGYTAELQNTNVTAEQLIEVYQANAAAATFAENSAVQAELLAEKDKLQALYDALLEATLPVVLTTDTNVPSLYVIKTKRGGNPVLQYDADSQLFGVATAVEKESAQAFYFMKGDETAGGTLQVYIYPYMAEGKVLAADDVDDGHSKAKAMDKGTATYEQWVFVSQAEGYYNLQPTGTSTYLSNFNGTDYKMGFYSSNPGGDLGSLFMFEATTIVGGHNYLKLKDYYEHQTKVNSTIQGSTAVGYYPMAQAEVYNAAYSAATEALANTETTAEAEYQTIYADLVAANEALVMNMPEEDKFYRFVSVVKGNGSDEFVYADPADNKMHWSKKGTSDATAIWTITPSGTEGMYNVTNLHTGSSINTFINYNPTPLSETAGEVSIVSLSANDGQIGIKCGDRMMHAQGGGAIVHWETSANDASAWRIVEVTDEELSLVEFTLAISKYRHAGLYLNYSVEIPENVKVYIAHTSTEGAVIADELEGTILPARTAAIVKGNEGSYNFKRTTVSYDGADVDAFESNVLGGSAYLKYQQVKREGNRCCVFGQKNGEVGLYKNYVQYVDANGSTTVEEGEGEEKDYKNSDNGTHFKISPNKIYFEYDPNTVSNATAFLFRLNDKTTGLDRLVMDGDTVIYDLYGRRLVEIVAPGFYVINGKKTYVTEKMIGNK